MNPLFDRLVNTVDGWDVMDAWTVLWSLFGGSDMVADIQITSLFAFIRDVKPGQNWWTCQRS